MLFPRIGHAGRGARQLARFAALIARFDARDALLDLPDVRGVLLEALLVGRAERAAERGHLPGQHVEDAAIGRAPHRPLFGRSAGAEQLLEHHARVADHRQRLFGRGPADRVGVDAGIAVRAAAGLVDRLDAELHRRDRRVRAELLDVELIHRRPDADVRSFGELRPAVREHDRARAEVVAADFGRLERFGHPRVGVADDRQVFAEGLERREAAFAQVEGPAGLLGIPEELRSAVLAAPGRAVHLLDADEARAVGRLAGGGLGERRAGGDHRVEQGQRDRSAQPSEGRATRHVLSGHNHDRSPFVRPARLLPRGTPYRRRSRGPHYPRSAPAGRARRRAAVPFTYVARAPQLPLSPDPAGRLTNLRSPYLGRSLVFAPGFPASVVSANAVRNAALFVIPRSSDDIRYSFAFASRTIFRIVGMS